ncbi:hypothetical protein [Anthocerotibacter panamensis]|uniref:hypothetical protein n=1 Tax=Anthocerotibacter panamensis TaxID=2857077 RepID=UPI001C405061|nr:hypothetical protein [Anthocerotibacter panamensis]
MVFTDPAHDQIARFTLEQLQFGTRYEYEVYLDGLRVERLGERIKALEPTPPKQSRDLGQGGFSL